MDGGPARETYASAAPPYDGDHRGKLGGDDAGIGAERGAGAKLGVKAMAGPSLVPDATVHLSRATPESNVLPSIPASARVARSP